MSKITKFVTIANTLVLFSAFTMLPDPFRGLLQGLMFGAAVTAAMEFFDVE